MIKNLLYRFRSTIQGSGLELPNIIAPNKSCHIHCNRKCRGSTAGVRELFNDGLGVSFGGWLSALAIAATAANSSKSDRLTACHHWPATELLFAGGDDRLTISNPVTTKALAAEIASSTLLALPQEHIGSPDILVEFNDQSLSVNGVCHA